MFEETALVVRLACTFMAVTFIGITSASIFCEWYRNENWIETEAVVLDQDIIETQRTKLLPAGKCLIPIQSKETSNVVHYSYMVDDVEYTGCCKVPNSLSAGTGITILYNPNNVGESIRK